jgi:hypothetical protein
MTQQLKVSGNVSLPFEDGTNVAPIDLTALITLSNGRADYSRTYSAPVTDDPVDFGTLTAPGAKGVLVKVISGSCTIKFNAGSTAWPLAVGGYFLWINPATPFATAATISTTGPASVVFLAVG